MDTYAGPALVLCGGEAAREDAWVDVAAARCLRAGRGLADDQLVQGHATCGNLEDGGVGPGARRGREDSVAGCVLASALYTYRQWQVGIYYRKFNSRL
jgi:hypothetical protein